MPDKPPKARLPDTFASFGIAALGQGTRRKARWAINPMRAEAHASAEGARLASIEAEMMQGLGRKREGRE
jgi:hypothetical protein